MKLNFPSHIAFWDLGWNMILQYAPPISATHVPSFPHFGHAARTAKRCTATSTRSTPWPLPSPSGDEKRGARAVSRPDGIGGRQGFFWGKWWNIYDGTYWQGFRILELFGRIWNMSSQTWTDSFRHFSSCLGLRICYRSLKGGHIHGGKLCTLRSRVPQLRLGNKSDSEKT